MDRQNGDDLQRIRFDDEDFIGDDEVTQGVAQIKPLRGDPAADAQQTVPSDQLVDRLIDAMVANND